MDLLRSGGVELGLGHPGTRAQPLHVTRTDDRSVPERVFMLELSRQHVSQNLDCAVRLVIVAFAGSDAVLVDDAQWPEVLEHGIVVIGKRERMVRLQPAVIGVTPIQTPADFEHAASSLWIFPMSWALCRRPPQRHLPG